MDKLIVVYGGAFSPVTTAHLSLAEQLTNQYNVEKVLFVPVSDLYVKKELLPALHRVAMLKKVCKSNPKFKVCEVDVKSKKLLYTIDSLKLIQKSYPNKKLAFLMGSDNLKQIHTWQQFETLMKEFKFIVINRNGDNTEDIVRQSEYLRPFKDSFIHFQETIRNDGNSSYIRELLKTGKSIRYLVHDEVLTYIKRKKLFIKERGDCYGR